MTFNCSKRAWLLRGQEGVQGLQSPTGRAAAAATVLISVTRQAVMTLYDAKLELHGLSLLNQAKGEK